MIGEKPFFYRKYVIFSIFFIIFILLLLFVRNFYYQVLHEKEVKKSVGLEKVKAYERVILNHFPLSPYTERAVKELLSICEGFLEEKEKNYCYETLRSSLIQIRSFYQPYEEVIDELKPKIADLRATLKNKGEQGKKEEYERIFQAQLEILNYHHAPSCFWSIVTVFSLLGWITSLIIVIFKGFAKPLNKRWLAFGGVSYLFFFCLWLLGLLLA